MLNNSGRLDEAAWSWCREMRVTARYVESSRTGANV
jgi:hypothetical protein